MNDQKENNQNQISSDPPIIIKRSWAKTVSIIGVTAIIVFGMVYVFTYLMNMPGKAVDKVGETLTDIAFAFKSGTVITEFRSYTTEVSSSNYLQIALLKTNETFSKTDSKKFAWQILDLPDVEVEIMAPVEYTFYLDLSEKWNFILHDQGAGIIEVIEVIVHAPKIKYNTPSVNISRLTVNVKKGSIFRDEEKVKEKLRREIMFICKRRAKKKIDLIRAIARDEVEKFVQKWFINFRFKDNKIQPYIKAVYFADEEYPEKIIKDLPEPKVKEKL